MVLLVDRAGAEVEVVVRTVARGISEAVDVFELIASLAPGTRSKEDIDRQLAEERGTWGAEVISSPS